jgi:20S proteasome subunit beta 2
MHSQPASKGFSFANHARNQMLLSQGCTPPRATSTGTTIVGLIYNDGVVLGADTRATEGPIVADKNCEKIHYLAPNMLNCLIQGTAVELALPQILSSLQI